MTRTDERELVLGNKQLLSAFFVVVIVCVVFFTMGYFVGKNTANGGFNAGTAAAAGGTRPDAAGRPLDSGSQAASTTAPPDSTAPAVDPNAPVPTPVPVVSTPAPTPPVETKPAPRSEEKRPEATAPPTEMARPSAEQMYLQVSALRRPDADNMVKVLREHNFPALLGESSKPDLYRVLVGPFKTTGELGRVKSDLKAKGFDSIVAK